MVAKNERGMYVFGKISNGITVRESGNEEAGPWIAFENPEEHVYFSFDVGETRQAIKFMTRFIEMAENGELSTKVKPPEMTVTKEVVGEEITDTFLPEEKKDEGHGKVSEGLEGDSRAHKKSK